MPSVRSEDLATIRSMYALLTGRISSASGQYALDPDTKTYSLAAAFRREAQSVGGRTHRIRGASVRTTLNYAGSSPVRPRTERGLQQPDAG
jgi:hypothetical protein